MSALDRKLFRELRHSGVLLAAIISIIAIGVMCQVSMMSTYANLKEAQSRYYAQCRMADFWIDLKKVPLAELAPLAELPGVTEFRPRIQFAATVDMPRSAKPINGQVLSLPEEQDSIINDIVLKRGGYFTTRRSNEVIINDAFAQHHKVQPGDWIYLLLNNRRQELFVVGTAISAEFTYLLGPGGHYARSGTLRGVLYQAPVCRGHLRFPGGRQPGRRAIGAPAPRCPAGLPATGRVDSGAVRRLLGHRP